MWVTLYAGGRAGCNGVHAHLDQEHQQKNQGEGIGGTDLSLFGAVLLYYDLLVFLCMPCFLCFATRTPCEVRYYST